MGFGDGDGARGQCPRWCTSDHAGSRPESHAGVLGVFAAVLGDIGVQDGDHREYATDLVVRLEWSGAPGRAWVVIEDSESSARSLTLSLETARVLREVLVDLPGT